jgi:hydroxyacylglutathione hydrolase
MMKKVINWHRAWREVRTMLCWYTKLTSVIPGLAMLLLAMTACNSQTPETAAVNARSIDRLTDLTDVNWVHGAQDCDAEQQRTDYSEWQQVRYQEDTYIFRQNKCSNYEAPFVYLFVGTKRALLIDTGATVDGGADLVRIIRTITDVPVIVAHTHGHEDHRLGDDAFQNAEAMNVVEIGARAVREFFGFENWPEEAVSLELGDRRMELLPIPGHADDDIAFYDPTSQFVVTGDTLYPGRLYIGEWSEYRASISRLARWIENRPVSHVMGTHIEMSNTLNVDYPIGTTYQPNEHPLPLAASDITELNEKVAHMDDPARTYFGSYIIWPRE